MMPSRKIEALSFESEGDQRPIPFTFQSTENTSSLVTLNEQYALGELAKDADELSRVLALLDWTRNRFEHSGSNQPSDFKVLTILKEAEEGNKFRCVEYGIVLKSALSAQGFQARTLGLKTKDVEITKIGAGHVLTEVWLNSHQKWVLMDGQINVMPMLNEVPLNAVEFQRAIIEKSDFQLVNAHGELSKKERKKYLRFIPHYLYYFDYRLDQREVSLKEMNIYDDKPFIMLLPIGAKEPTVFQRKHEMDGFIFTNSLAEFYAKPN
ncbi:MAG TPA: transglutaminase domain-containing protein [Cyclobacteriaceae bacterium]|nr:transglutaminase domain-containing protein [Cyclobacteriaceae bacterium]